jgi:hypothetical protein
VGSDLLRFDGWIAGAAFSSGDRFVVGRWPRSPLGSFADVMWSRPDRTRVLVAPDERVLRFVGGHYTFEERRLASVVVQVSTERVHATVPDLALDIDLELDRPGLVSALLALRPRSLRTRPAWLTVEDVALRPLVSPLLGGGAGIRARGRTRRGAREWYGIHAMRTARASARIGGEDLGPAVPARPCGFGFSEFPPMPAAVRVTSLIEASPSAD